MSRGCGLFQAYTDRVLAFRGDLVLPEVGQVGIMLTFFQVEGKVRVVVDDQLDTVLAVVVDLLNLNGVLEQLFQPSLLADDLLANEDGGTPVIEGLTNPFRRVFLGEDKRHRAVLAFTEVDVGLYRLVDIGIADHGQLLVETPLLRLGKIGAAVGHLNALHVSSVVKLGMHVPPFRLLGLLGVPSRVVPEDERALRLGGLERVHIIRCVERFAIVDVDRVVMARCHIAGDLTALDQDDILVFRVLLDQLIRTVMISLYVLFMRAILNMFCQGDRVQSLCISLIDPDSWPDQSVGEDRMDVKIAFERLVIVQVGDIQVLVASLTKTDLRRERQYDR